MPDTAAAGNIIQILANLPDFLRKPMIQGRLKEFFSMSEDDKRETIAMALQAAPSIDPSKLAVLFRTWLEVIAEFEPEKRAILFRVYSQQVLANSGPLQKLDFRALIATFLSLGQRQRELIVDSLHETLLSIHNGQQVLSVIPEEARRALKLS